MPAVHASRLNRLAVMGFWAGFLCCLGCENAHYVVRSPDSGIVSIPEDTPELRAKAEKLMHEQFPGGYVIDDVRLVAVGRPHHLHDEVMLYYHAGTAKSAGGPVVVVGPPPNPLVVPHVQPASAAPQPGALPAQPIPVNAP